MPISSNFYPSQAQTASPEHRAIASLQPKCKYGENDPESPRSSLGVLGSNLNGKSKTSTIDLNMCSIHLHLTGCRWDCLENEFNIYIEYHLHLYTVVLVVLCAPSILRPRCGSNTELRCVAEYLMK
jgi:hypothetical protein